MSKLGARKKVLLSAAALVTLAAPTLTGFFSGTVLAQQDDGAWLPIVKVAPVYPQRALERELEGYVIVEYTVTETGSVADAFVVESSSGLFEEAAVQSALKYKYEPRTENGEPVAVPGMRTVIRFVLEQDV